MSRLDLPDRLSLNGCLRKKVGVPDLGHDTGFCSPSWDLTQIPTIIASIGLNPFRYSALV
jgi:hypothetical protein